MKQTLVPTGIEAIGNIPWGTHFCHFYQTKEDLLSMQVPFFKAGLENNEYCIWITSERTSIGDAINALKEEVPDLDTYYERRSIEILSHHDWYLTNGRFELDNVIQSILDRLRVALERGFGGLRLNGDEAWMDHKTSHDFIEYERMLNPAIAGKKLIILCSYQLAKCTATDVLDVALLHESAVSKRRGKWEILETPQLIETKAQLNLEKESLEKRIAKSTRELHRITDEVKKERSERKKATLSLRKSQLRLKTIVDTADIAFVLFDSGSRVCLFNAIASYWSTLSFGVPLQQYIYFPDLLNENGKARFSEMMNTVLSGQSLNYETSYQGHGDHSEWYRVSIHPVMDDDGKAIGVICSASNITQGKQIESAHEHLSGQLVQRNKDVEKFAFILSHDLRAPLANMLGLAEMLKRRNVSESEKRDIEEFLFQSVEKLDEVVHDLNRVLQLDKTQSLKKEKVDLTKLVNEVSARFQPVAKQDTIKIFTNFDDANEIFSVKSYLDDIFYNLISSSIIFNEAAKPPVIEIASEKTRDKIIIYFKNFGKGRYRKGKKAKPDSYKKLNMSYKRQGIGLSTVKTKVDVLRGAISIGILPDSGKEYRIELPLD